MRISKKIRFIAMLLVIIMSIQLVPANAIDMIKSSLLKDNDEIGVDVNNNTKLKKEDRVIAEIADERTNREKRFLMNDGKVNIASYNEDIHYVSNGKWYEIDNRLTHQNKKNNKDFNGYINTNNSFVVKFAESSKNDLLYTVSEETYKISLGILSSKESKGLNKNDVNAKIKQNSSNNKKGYSLAEQVILENNIAHVTYQNIWDGVDIQYSLAGKSVKEDIVIHNKQQNYIYEFTLSLVNLKAKLSNDDGSIELCDPELNNSVKYIIPAPFMFDANGRTSSNVKYELEEYKDNYIIRVIADESWINNTETKFPVTIDPALEKKGYNTYGIQDTYVIEGNPNSSSQHNYTRLHVGYDSGYEYRRRIYVKYTNLPVLPESAVIVDSKFSYSQLSSTYPGYSGNDGLVLGIKEVTNTWNALTLSWNTQPSNNGIILDYVTTSKDTALQNHYWNITSAVQNWYSLSNPNSNNGFVIMPDIEYINDDGVVQSGSVLANVRLASSEASLSNSLAPSLQITYRDIKGLEDYWTYHTFNYGDSLTGYINDFSGQLTIENINFQSEEDSLSISHIYNSFQRNMGYSALAGMSSLASAGGTGYGWRLNLQERVSEISFPSVNDITSYYFIHTDADGTDHYFYRGTSSSNLEATDEDGLGQTIVKNANGTYRLTCKDGTEKNFGTSGELKSIKIGIRTYDIIYSNNKINSIYCYNEEDNTLTQHYSFTYDGNGFLSQITNIQNSESINFTYNSSGYLQTIQSFDGNIYSFSYNLGRVYQITNTDVLLPKYICHLSSNGKVYLYYDYYYGLAGEEVVGIVTVNPTYITYKSHATFFQTVGGDGIYNTNDDIIETYQFDHYGHTVNVYSYNKGKTESYGSSVIKYCDSTNNPDIIHSIQSIATDDGPVLNLAENPLLNNSFAPITQGVYTISTDTSTKYIGRNSIKISLSTPNTSVGYYSPSMVSHTASRSYIASFYIKTENVIGNGAYLRVSNPYYSSCNYESVPITGTTSPDVNDGWQRVYMYIYLPIGSMYTSFQFILDSSVGTVWFDGFQLEMVSSTNTVCSEMSLLTQGAPVYSLINSAWERSSWGVNYNSADMPLGDGYSFELKGLPKGTSFLRQTVLLDSNINEVFTFSGFSKANSVKTISSDINLNDNTQKLYCVGAIITLSDGVNTITQRDYTSLNCDITDWQTFTHMIAVDTTDENITSNMRITSIAVEMIYQRNANKAYFTQLCLTRSASISLKYGEDGKIIGINANGSSVEYLRDENGDLIQETVSDSYVREGNKGTVIKADGSSVEYTYITVNDEEVDESCVFKNQAGIITKKIYKIYDSNGNVSRLVEKDSDFEILNYLNESVDTIIDYTYISYLGDDGKTKYLVSSVSEKDGSLNDKNLTNYSYDTNHNITAKAHYDYEGSNYSYSSWTYDSDGNILTSTDELGNTTTYTYDNKGNILSETKPNGRKIGYIYDAKGNLTSCFYDANNDGIYDVSETGIIYSYNTNNQLVKIDANTDYIFIYDRFERLRKISVGDANNNQELVSYTYQYSTGRLQTTEYANGWLQRYVYDNNDNVTKVYYSNTRENISEYLAHEWIYSINNVLFKYIDNENGRVYYFEHNDDGKVLRTIVRDINTEAVLFKVEYVYKAGELKSYRYIYANNEVEEISFIYNDNYDFGSYTNGLGHITFEYDTMDRLASKAIEFANLTLTNQYTYAKTQPLLSTSYSVISSITLADGTVFSYNYDSNGNITEVYENSILKQSYVYDALDQLVRENNAYANKTYVWAYDNGGNILSKTEYQYTTGALGAVQNTSSYGYTDAIWKDKLTSYNGIPITYDENGNPLSYYNGQSYTFTWKNGRELASALVGSTSVSYTYDANGIRNSKTVNSVKYTYFVAGTKIIQETYGNNVLFYYYDETDSIMGVKYNGTMYLFEKNLQGDVIKIYNESGVVVCNYTYDAWGKVISITGSESTGIGVINPFRYRGYYYDAETGFYYLQSRYYDTTVGRFINSDDAYILKISKGELLSTNLFAYCGNNPIKNIDPSGYAFYTKIVKGWNAWLRVAHYFGKSVWNIYNMKVSFAVIVATAVTVVAAIVALTNFVVNFVGIVFNLHNAIAALVYTIKYNGFQYSGFRFWFGIGLEVVSKY